MATLSSGSLGSGMLTGVEENLGVYKRLEDVSERYRLHNFASQFLERDVWEEWMEAEKADLAESTRKYKYGKSERLWKEHMGTVGRHHALAQPQDVEIFLADQLEQVQIQTVWNSRYSILFNFYDWLAHNDSYPHVYNPVLMAAVDGEASRRMWEYRVEVMQG